MKSFTNKLLSYPALFIVIAAVVWSLDGVIRKNLYEIPSVVVVFYEHLFGTILLLPFLPAAIKAMKKMGKKEWIALAITGILSGAVATILYTQAFSKTTFTTVALFQQLQPIWAISTAAIVLKEKVTKNYFPWAVLAIISTYFITFKDLSINLERDAATITGALLALGAGMIWGAGTSSSKILLKALPFNAALLIRFIVATAAAFAFTFILGSQEFLTTLRIDHIQELILLTLSAGMVGTAIYYFGLRNTPAKVSAIAELAWPVSAFLIGVFYFKETYTWTQVAGMIALVVSIFMVSRLKELDEKALQ